MEMRFDDPFDCEGHVNDDIINGLVVKALCLNNEDIDIAWSEREQFIQQLPEGLQEKIRERIRSLYH